MKNGTVLKNGKIDGQTISDRLQRRFLDRLAVRIKTIRRLYVERLWQDLRSECSALMVGGEQFGFKNLTFKASRVKEAIPEGKLSRATTLPLAKKNTEHLIYEIDHILIENSVHRN